MADNTRFRSACAEALNNEAGAKGIGTLGEKALHAAVKRYIEPDASKHEVKLGSFVVDIYSGGRVYEIQTRQFDRLRPKLKELLPGHKVTIVCPLPAKKWLVWIDPESGEMSKPRLSPRRGNVYDVFYELYRIKPQLVHPNLSLLILLIDMEEYRLLNGWSRDRKRGAWRNERLPVSLERELFISGPEEFGLLLPEELPDGFTSSDYAKACAISVNQARRALNVLRHLNIIAPAGKRGRQYQYIRLKTGL